MIGPTTPAHQADQLNDMQRQLLEIQKRLEDLARSRGLTIPAGVVGTPGPANPTQEIDND